MTRALLVDGDRPTADRAAVDLEVAGYRVSRCAGPQVVGCPVLDGSGCALVERADVLVYDAAAARATGGSGRLIDCLRSLYGDRAIVVVGPDRGADDVWRMAIAIEDALADR